MRQCILCQRLFSGLRDETEQTVWCLARLPGISANSNENMDVITSHVFANISEYFRTISRNIKFAENLQLYCMSKRVLYVVDVQM